MFNHFKSLLHSFLLSFEYSKKFQFSLYLSFLTALLIAILILKSETNLAKRYPLQIKGVSYVENLHELLQNLIEYRVVRLFPDQKDSSRLQVNIQNNLHRLTEDNDIAAELIGSKSQSLQDLLFYHNALANRWEALKKESPRLTGLLYYKMLQHIHFLAHVANEAFFLSGSIDSGTSYLIQAYTENLSKIRFTLSEFILLIDSDSSAEIDIEPLQANLVLMDMALKSHIENLVYNITEAQDALQSSFPKSIRRVADPVDFGGAYNTTIANLLNFTHFLSEDLKPQQHLKRDEITAQGMKTLRDTMTMLSSFALNLNIVLKTQQDTLNFHKYLGLGCILLGMILAYLFYMTRVFRRPLADLKNAIEELTAGNLSVRAAVTSNDEVSSMCIVFNEMAEFFEKIMSQTKDLAAHLTISTANICATRDQLELNLVRQEEAITHIADNAKYVSRAVQDFALSLKCVNNAAVLTSHLVSLGKISLADMQKIIHQMTDASNNVISTLSTLQSKSENIHSVIDTIITIADQVNLLSLNTAIGSAKKELKHLGFSVIASEIQTVADQTAGTTLGFSDSLKTIGDSLAESSQEVDHFYNTIQDQTQEAKDIGESLKKLVSYTQAQVTSFEAINRGMEEQTERATKISGSIVNLTSNSKKSTQSIKHLYLEIEYLYYAAYNLQTMTQNFVKDVVDRDA